MQAVQSCQGVGERDFVIAGAVDVCRAQVCLDAEMADVGQIVLFYGCGYLVTLVGSP